MRRWVEVKIIMKPDARSQKTRTLSQAGLTTSGLAEDRGARGADNDGLRVREDGSDGEAA